MSAPVMKSPISEGEMKQLTQGLYRAFLSPRFIARTLLSIRSVDDLKFVARAGKAVLGHLRDFAAGRRQ